MEILYSLLDGMAWGFGLALGVGLAMRATGYRVPEIVVLSPGRREQVESP